MLKAGLFGPRMTRSVSPLCQSTIYPRYKNEIVPVNQIIPPKPEISESELDMAVSLIKVMAGHFQPELYKDEYQSALKEMVGAKIKGEKVVVPESPRIEIGDLMASLRASIEAARKEPVGASKK